MATTQGSLIAAIQAGQMAVGATLKGAQSSPADIEASHSLYRIGETLKESKKSKDKMVSLLFDTLMFDKEAFRRERDSAREREKEQQKALSNSSQAIKMPTKEEAGFNLPKIAIGGLLGLTALAKATDTEDFLRLPQQLKGLKAMAAFAKGVGTLSTLGFGPKLVDDMKAGLNSIKLNPKNVKDANTALNSRFVNMLKPVRGLFAGISMNFDLMRASVLEKFGAMRAAITENKFFTTISENLKGSFARIGAVFKPITDTVKSMFGQGGSVSKTLDSILEPLRKVGRFIGKLFLPITLILGVIDGVTGFMKEYEETGKVVDGIRGAVVGIVDGFIGTFVRLITDLVGMALEYLGLDNLGGMVRQFGENITAEFSQVIGGIVDIFTGIFTFDGDRILSGFGNMFSGVGGFFMNVLTAPIDMAINFVKDIFGFGDPEKPFSLSEFLGGVVDDVVEWFTSMFDFDFDMPSLGDIGRLFSAITEGGMAAVGAMLPGGESPLEAFQRVFDEVMSSGSADTSSADVQQISRVTTENVQGDVTTTTYNTRTISENPNTTNMGNTVIAPVNNVNSVSKQSNTSLNTVPLNTSVDRYYERESWSDMMVAP
jgi:hypothetical protein